MKSILNDNTTWGNEAGKIDDNFTELNVQDTLHVKLFNRFDVSEDQFKDINTTADVTTRAQMYMSIKDIKLFGFDKQYPHRISHLWINYEGTYRLILERLKNGAWERIYDRGTTAPNIIANVWYYDYDLNGLRVSIAVDLKGLPVTVYGELETPGNTTASYVIAEDQFQDVVSFNAIDAKTITTFNEVLFPCFSRFKADISSLDDDFFGKKRKTIYQAFKSARLIGFDPNTVHKLSFFMNQINSGDGYRIIIDSYNSASGVWDRTYDVAITGSTFGIEAGREYHWDIVDGVNGNTRLIADIDFSNATTGTTNAFTDDNPELIFKPSCVEVASNISMNVFNANKLRYHSRRKPTFAFIWDDLQESDELVYSVFQEFGFLPSFALQSNKLTARISKTYQDLYRNGCTILSHSVDHSLMGDAATMTYAEAEAQMRDSKNEIEQYGIKVSGWVTPNSNLDASFLPLVEKYYGYGFHSNLYDGYDHLNDPIKIRRLGLEGLVDHDITPITNYIDDAIANNYLRVFYGHKLPSIPTNTDGSPQLTVDDLRSILSYLKAKVDGGECYVYTSDEAIYQYYKSPFA